MKTPKIVSILLTTMLLLSANTAVYAVEEDDSTLKFGDVLYSGNGITVFYGNPNGNEELVAKIEAQAARSLQYDNIWVNANTSTTRYASIDATSSNPITYFTIKQESNSTVPYSRVVVNRPNNDGVCYHGNWDNTTNKEVSDIVISTSVLWDEPFGMNKYAWTDGTLSLMWDVETGDSGARMNLWAW